MSFENIHNDSTDVRGACIFLFSRGKKLNVLLKKIKTNGIFKQILICNFSLLLTWLINY